MTQGKKKALIIAVSEYEILSCLSFCKNDGDKMYEVLKSLGYEISFNNKQIGTVKWGEMRQAIIKFFTQNVKSKDTLLFYFSGHAIPDGYGDNYLATSEIDPDIPYDKGFSFDEFTKMMQRSISTKIISILDCCYSGAAKVTKGNDEDAARLGTVAIRNKSLALEGEGRCILAASQALQKAFDLKEKKHSLFTYYLLDGLQGANGDSVDNSGHVTPDTLGSYVYDKVTELSPNQKPIRKVEASGDIILAYYPQFAKGQIESKLDYLDTDSIIADGKHYLDRNEFSKAADFYSDAIRKFPNQPSAWRYKGVALGYLGKFEEAINCFNVSIMMDPNQAGVLEDKGFCLTVLKKYDEALQCYDKALEIDPDGFQTWVRKGEALYILGRYAEAEKCYDKALEKEPANVMIWHYKGKNLREQGRYQEALECYDKALKKNPEKSQTWVSKEALPKSLLEVTDKNIWNAKGRLLTFLRNYQEAIYCYDKALEIDQDYFEAWYEKGKTLDKLEQYKEAITCYDKTLSIDSKHVAAWNDKGIMILKLQQYNEAISCLGKALELNPKNDILWTNKGDALRLSGRHGEAIEDYDKALELNPKNEVAWNNKALVFYELGRYIEAIQCYNKSLTINPNNEITLNNQGLAYYKLLDYDEAINCYDRILVLNPNAGIVLNNKGDALSQLGRQKEAATCYERAEKLGTKREV